MKRKTRSVAEHCSGSPVSSAHPLVAQESRLNRTIRLGNSAASEWHSAYVAVLALEEQVTECFKRSTRPDSYGAQLNVL
jgi:hypothetical protein